MACVTAASYMPGTLQSPTLQSPTLQSLPSHCVICVQTVQMRNRKTEEKMIMPKVSEQVVIDLDFESSLSGLMARGLYHSVTGPTGQSGGKGHKETTHVRPRGRVVARFSRPHWISSLRPPPTQDPRDHLTSASNTLPVISLRN